MTERYDIKRAKDDLLRAQIINMGADIDQRVGKEVIEANKSLWIPAGYQMTIYGGLTVLGEIIIEGTLYLLSPCRHLGGLRPRAVR